MNSSLTGGGLKNPMSPDEGTKIPKDISKTLIPQLNLRILTVNQFRSKASKLPQIAER